MRERAGGLVETLRLDPFLRQADENAVTPGEMVSTRLRSPNDPDGVNDTSDGGDR